MTGSDPGGCNNVTEMFQCLSQVFAKLPQANLKLKPAKRLLCHQVTYIGHIVFKYNITTDPQKVQKD